jgi:hypothetical protein
MLYLLRQPIWGSLTKRAVGTAKNWAAKVPGPIGGWMLRYVLQWIIYVQKHHFLLEGAI